MVNILHIASGPAHELMSDKYFTAALKEVGHLEIMENAAELPEEVITKKIRACEILITCWGANPVPDAIAENPGKLSYICHLTGEMGRYVTEKHFHPDISITNWGAHPSDAIAEHSIALLMAVLRNFPARIIGVRESGNHFSHEIPYNGFLNKLSVGIYGLGHIGKRCAEMLAPFSCQLYYFDPYVRQESSTVLKLNSLEELFAKCQAVIIHAGSTPETEKSITAEHLSMLPDGGIIINTARGEIIDQEALFAELKTGRLRAGLDVLVKDKLPDEAETKLYSNLLWTGHKNMDTFIRQEGLQDLHKICLDNLRNFLKGEELANVVTKEIYMRST